MSVVSDVRVSHVQVCAWVVLALVGSALASFEPLTLWQHPYAGPSYQARLADALGPASSQGR